MPLIACMKYESDGNAAYDSIKSNKSKVIREMIARSVLIIATNARVHPHFDFVRLPANVLVKLMPEPSSLLTRILFSLSPKTS